MKSLSYFVVGLLLVSGFAAVGMQQEADVADTLEWKTPGESNVGVDETISLQFLEPVVVRESVVGGEKYVELGVEGANAVLHHGGEPMLPIYTETFILPFGTRILNVECESKEVKSMDLPYKIMNAPDPVPVTADDPATAEDVPFDVISDPEDTHLDGSWVSYYTGGGLDRNNKHKTFLTVRVYPVKYSPDTDTIEYVEDMEVTIKYEEPANPITFPDEYDLVIIAPSELSSELQKLVDHKNSFGVDTVLKTTEDIYAEYSGVDEPEQIKYFIKYALDEWGVKYVLLVGGMKSLIWAKPKDNRNYGTSGWRLPVRYTNNLYEGSAKISDPGFLCDLYFADIYDGEAEFQSWDSDKNGVADGTFAKWTMMAGGKDILDLYPDVYVGRLACRNIYEVRIMVNKIINYEKGASGSSWYDKMIVVGGDSFDDTGTDYNEGEVVSDKILEAYMSEFDPVRIYASYKTSNPPYTPIPDNIVREITEGAGHLFFDGHANPGSWNTHWPGEDSWTGGIQVLHFLKLKNKEKLPICCVEGCHNSQFNITLLSTLLDKENTKKTWCYGSPVPECWSWWLARKIGGGSLATIGNTGLGYGTVGEHGDLDGDGNNEPDCIEALGGYAFGMFYKSFDEGADILGEAWGGAITKYLNTFPGMSDQLDCKIMQEWALLGDPSLKIGGYSSSKVKIIDGASGLEGYLSTPCEFQASGGTGYVWDFGDGNTATGQTVSHTWDSPGIYWVSVEANEGTYDTVVDIKLQPNKPSGPTSGTAGNEYTFTAHVDDDRSWDRIFYIFDWGDGTDESDCDPVRDLDWEGIVFEDTTPDTPFEAKHTWNSKGTYKVRVKAWLIKRMPNPEDDIFEETGWSDELSVSMPKSEDNNDNNDNDKTDSEPLLQRVVDRFSRGSTDDSDNQQSSSLLGQILQSKVSLDVQLPMHRHPQHHYSHS